MNFPTDTDGFLSQECPSCEQRFKVLLGQGSDEPIAYCPYCGHNGKDVWYTKEQVDYFQSVALSSLVRPELKKLEQQIKNASKGLIKFGTKVEIPEPQSPPMETDDAFDLIHFPCCNETIKVSPNCQLFCVICGKEIDLKTSESKKVFLSHKGVDKETVRDFKKTLELIGYDPWLDEDAMPAGAALDRAILKGMQDSCGVVFFITPSFRDEGYLATEVNYAVQEKRTKGDKFAIVTLQMANVTDDHGSIPDLLKPFVWKKPTTLLEAVREIIRALPVIPGVVDWRSENTGVVTTPKVKSTTTELSLEAKAILSAAVESGRISHLRSSGGVTIQAGSKSLMPDQSPKTVAQWVGGLEDLLRRRFIKDLGHKNQVFVVTREGFDAASQL